MYLLLFFLSTFSLAKTPLSLQRLDQLSGVSSGKFEGTKASWDKRYSRPLFIYGKSPARFLAENYSYIPEKSKILDMGMGEGRNAVFLAQKGHSVTGVDISSVAVKKSFMLAREYGVKIQALVASLKKYNFPANSFDSIICFYYVDRSLISNMLKWVKDGGIIIFEAHTLRQKERKTFEEDPDSYFLEEQELLSLFKEHKILKFEEPIHEGDFRSSIIIQVQKKVK